MMIPVKRIPFFAPLLCTALLVGCTAKPPPTATGTATKPPVTSVTATDEASKSFLATLESQPTFDARIQYVNAHQDEASKVGQSKDQAIIQKYSQLMTPPQMVQKPRTR